MNSKKTIILILIFIVILLGASSYIAWQDRNARKTGRPVSASMTEEDILRSLAPLAARELSAEEMAKEERILKSLAPASKLSPTEGEKEKEILRSLAP
mgnify:CR=1 FL=1